MLKLKWQLSPIVIKEMRSTMRGKRTFVGLTLFLLFLTVISLLTYQGVVQGSSATSVSAQAGRTVFITLSILEILMLVTVTPPLTSGAIANERQRQTFDMLMATPLTPGEVLRGKLLASMNYLFLLMFASLPINSIAFLFGGTSPSALLWWAALTVVLLLMLGTLGLFISTLFRSSGVATSITYLTCVVCFAVLPLLIAFTAFITTQGSNGAGCIAAAMFMLHPAGALTALFADGSDPGAAQVLPAFLALYGALAGALFLAAEARLSALTSQRWRRPFLSLALLLVMGATSVYLVLGPAAEMCGGLP